MIRIETFVDDSNDIISLYSFFDVCYHPPSQKQAQGARFPERAYGSADRETLCWS